MTAPAAEALSWDAQQSLDDESYRAQLAYLYDRSPFYRAKLSAAGFDGPGGRRRAGRHREASAHRQARASSGPDPGRSVRRAPLRRSRRHRPDPLDERHHGHAELHPAHRGRPRQLGDGIVAELRGVRRRPGRQHRLDLQRRPVRGRGRARGPRADRALPHPGRHREHRAADARRSSGSRPDCGRADAVLCRLSDRVGGGAGPRPARLERRAPARRR